MAGIKDFLVVFEEDFLGPQTLTTSPAGSDRWKITDTSANGTPTYTVGSANGVAVLAFDNTSEVQNVCMNFNDVLNFDIDQLIHAEFGVKTVASLNAASSLAFGMSSNRNDAIDSMTAHASFRCIGSNSVVVESDDGTTDKDDVSTGTTLVATFKHFVIDFQNKSDVKFSINGARVAASTTFDMSAHTTGLQPYVQLQKTAATTTDSVSIDYIRVVCKRA